MTPICNASLKGSRIFVFLFIFFIQFKSVFASLNLSFISNGAIALAPIIGFVGLIVRGKISRAGLLVLFYVTYLLAVFFISVYMSPKSNYFGGMVGYLALAGFLIFWLGVESTLNARFVLKIFLLFGIVNAIGAIINYFYSPTIFGLIYHHIYTNPDIFLKDNVTQRAVSFLPSPQSLTLFLAVSFVLADYLIKKSILYFSVKSILFFGIILSVSKASFVFLLVFYTLLFVKRPFAWLGAAFMLFGTLFIFSAHLERILYLFDYLKDITSYSAFPMWASSFEVASSWVNQIFGSGLGLFSRPAQEVGGYVVAYGSTESFLLQIFVETGIVGLILFLSVYTAALALTRKTDYPLFCLLIALMVVGIFSPALYGFASAIYFYFLIVCAVSAPARGVARLST